MTDKRLPNGWNTAVEGDMVQRGPNGLWYAREPNLLDRGATAVTRYIDRFVNNSLITAGTRGSEWGWKLGGTILQQSIVDANQPGHIGYIDLENEAGEGAADGYMYAANAVAGAGGARWSNFTNMLYFKFIVRMVTTGGTGNMHFGWGSNASSGSGDAPAFGGNSVFFTAKFSDHNWHAQRETGSAHSAIDSGLDALQGPWYVLEAYHNLAGTWTFRVNDVDVAGSLTGGPLTGCIPFVFIDGALPYYVRVDEVEAVLHYPSGRYP